jgi:chromate transporter
LYRFMINNSRIKELAGLFLKLGCIAFGGPVAHIAMMHNEVVVKRKWIDEQHFLDLVGATNLIPGPNSTEIAIHIGRQRAGWKGLIISGICFILPAVIITGIFAWLYHRYGNLPDVQAFIYGIQPAIISIILAAVYPLAKKSLKTIELAVIGIIVLGLSLVGVNEILAMFGAGLLAVLLFLLKKKSQFTSLMIFPLLHIHLFNLLSVSNVKLFLIFLKVGALLYGSGYVLFAFLDQELVEKGLLSREELVDAIAVGQFTPGPVFSSVTFIGYQLNGLTGAMVSTIAIFLPSFLFVALLNPLVRKMRSSKIFSVFLDAVNVASVAVIITICYFMGKETINDWRTMLIAVLTFLVCFLFKKINSAVIVIGGSLLGYILQMI